MVLLNKAALSSFGFDAPTALLLFQCTACTIAAAGVGFSGLARLERPSWRLLRAWAPVNVLFVGMVWSSVFALRDLGVPMVTVLKNLTNLFTICGDFLLFGRVYGRRVWATLALMALSALCGAVTDLEFSAAGYAWQIANCAFTSAYSLALRLLMERGGEALWGGGSNGDASSSSSSSSLSSSAAAAAALAVGEKAALTSSHLQQHHRHSTTTAASLPRGKRLNELSMVFYNNALSLPLIAALAWARGDLGRASTEPALGDPRFLAAAGASAALAFGISFTSLWFLSTTTATTFSLVGSLNKVPVAVVGLVAFGVPATAQNVAAICVGLVASAVFVWAKQGDSGSSKSSGGGGGGGLNGSGVENGGGKGGGGSGAIGTVVIVGGSGVVGGGGNAGGGNLSVADSDALMSPPGSGSKALRR
jgi:GDP-mannose transporter